MSCFHLRAVALGLTADELIVVERFMEDLKDKKDSRRSRSETRSLDDREPSSVSGLSQHHLSQPSQKLFDDVARDNRALKTKLAHLEAENAKLLQGLKEVRMQLKDAGPAGKDGVSAIQMPTLDKLISVSSSPGLARS